MQLSISKNEWNMKTLKKCVKFGKSTFGTGVDSEIEKNFAACGVGNSKYELRFEVKKAGSELKALILWQLYTTRALEIKQRKSIMHIKERKS